MTFNYKFSKNNFLDWQKPFVWFLLALIARFALYFFNLKIAIPSGWQSVSWTSMQNGNYFCGLPPQEKLEILKTTFLHEDKGYTYFNYLICKITGESTFTKIQILQIFLDSSVVFAIWKIAQNISNRKNLPMICSALYAFYLPAMYAALNPIWYTLVIFCACHATALLIDIPKLSFWPSLAKKIIPAILLFVIASQFRATLALALPFAGVIVLFFALIYPGRIPKLSALILIFSGFFIFSANSLLNKFASEGTQIIRSHYAASFWLGMAESTDSQKFAANDDGIMAFYYENNPQAPKGLSLYSPEMNAWLQQEMLKTIRQEPILILKNYLKRSVKALAPNIRFSFIADLESFNSFEQDVLKTRDTRLAMLKAHDFIGIIKLSPRFAFEYFLRILLMLFFPLGAIFYFIKNKIEFSNSLAISLSLYPCLVLTLLRLPIFDHAALWIISIPLCLCGFADAMDFFRRKNA